jgi:hypothetical protein
MAKIAATKAKSSVVAKATSISTQVMTSLPDETAQVFKIVEGMTEESIVKADGMPGVRLEFDFVYFKKLSESFVATLKPSSQKAYWLAFAEFDSRDRRANIALHSIGKDPRSMMLDRPHGKSNPLVRDSEIVEKLLNKGLGKAEQWYVTWRLQGGQGDFTDALEAGFKAIHRPKDDEEKAQNPLEWSGELWRIPDGTSDPTSGDAIYNVMVVIRESRWQDHLKAMSMESHNQYSQNKQKFFDGAANISKDMLGGKEKVILQDLDETHVEEYYAHGKRE